MQIDVIGRHLPITETLDAHARERAGKLSRFYDRISKVEVIIEKTANTYRAEVVCHVDNHDHLVSHASQDDCHAAIDDAASKAERLVHDLKDKLRNTKHV